MADVGVLVLALGSILTAAALVRRAHDARAERLARLDLAGRRRVLEQVGSVSGFRLAAVLAVANPAVALGVAANDVTPRSWPVSVLATVALLCALAWAWRSRRRAIAVLERST